MGSRQQAEDLAQETLLRALRSAETFKLAEHGLRPWLFKILHNVIITRGVKSQREREVMTDFQHQPQAASCGISDHSSVNWDDVDERLKAAVADLALPYRATFLLSAIEGLKYREIADITDVPIGTVMSRLSRARLILAQKLAGLAEEEGLKQPDKPNESEGPPTS